MFEVQHVRAYTLDNKTISMWLANARFERRRNERLRFGAHLRHRRVTELDGESAFTENSLGKRFCTSPGRGEEGRLDRVGNAEGGSAKVPEEGLVTFVRPICPHRSAARKRERRKRGRGEKKKGGGFTSEKKEAGPRKCNGTYATP